MTRPLSIAIVTTSYPPDDGGGIGTYTHALAVGLAALGQTVHVVARSARTNEDLTDGVHIHRLSGAQLPKIEHHVPGFAWSVQVALCLGTIARQHGLDVVEFPNWEGVGFVYGLLPRRATVVTRLHTPFFETLELDVKGRTLHFGERFSCWLEEQAVRRSDHRISSTRAHRQLMSRNYGLVEDEIRILPLGIQLPTLGASPARPSNRPLKVLYVSRLENRKGTLTLLEAIPRVLAEVGPVEFVLAGKDRPHAPGGRHFAEYFAATYPQCLPYVTFAGFVGNAELEQHYRSCDFFVVPSQYESFGLIFVEAMAYGKPVIGGRAGGMVEVIADGETGYLVQVDNVDALVGRMVELLRDDSLRDKMGAAARQHVEAHFSSTEMAERTLALYRNLSR
jgi:glycosyltransferase involved in cell wall biosynthesis